MSSHRRARFICVLTGMVLAIPLGFLLMIRAQDQLDDYMLHHDTLEFIWPITAYVSSEPQPPRYLTHQSLFGKVTILVYLDAAHPSTHLTAALRTWIHHIDESLTLREHFAETELTTTGILASSHQRYPHLVDELELAQRQRAGRWYALAISPELRKDVLTFYRIQNPGALNVPESLVMIWDSAAQLRAILPEHMITSTPVHALLTITSRIHFQSSMDEYLRQRTFFGAKKKPASPVPPRTSVTDS